ncbi:MAG: tetratricopeptide repeat protein, partial [Anaerolineales bacterium]
LYLLTMRARLMIDWARLLIRRDRGPMAIDVLEIAQRMLPDKPARILIALYTGVAHLRSQDAPTAKTHLEKTLEMAAKGGLSSRNRTVCLYFLGHAHRLQGQTTEAKRSFREARDLMPKSPYAKAAAEALKEMRK